MNTPVIPGAQGGPADPDEVDGGDLTAFRVGAITSQSDIDKYKSRYGIALGGNYVAEQTGWDGLTKAQEARQDAQQERAEAERKLYEQLEADRARNNEIIAQLEAEDGELCKRIDQMDAGAIVMPDGRRAYKDKNGNFVYLDGAKVDDQEYARAQDAAHGGHTQGWEERAQAEATHNKYRKEIEDAQARNAQIDSVENGTASWDDRQRVAAKIHTETEQAVVAKDVVMEVAKKDNAANSVTTAAATIGSKDAFDIGEGTDDEPDPQSAEATTGQASRLSYSGGLAPSTLSSKGAFTVASATPPPASAIADMGQDNTGSSQRKPVTTTPTAVV